MKTAAFQVELTHADLTLLGTRARPFSSPEWLFELKFDGYRALAIRDSGVRILSRQGRSLAEGFPEVVAALQSLPEGTALDAELVILDSEGRPRFEPLARAWRSTPGAVAQAARVTPATLIAFDVLFWRGQDVRHLPIERRKRILTDAVRSTSYLRPLLPIAEHGEWLYMEAEALGLEGIVAKRKGSRYSAGRSQDWLKIKTPHARSTERQRFRRN